MDPTTEDLLTNEVFRWNPRKDSFEYFGKGKVMDRIAEYRNWTDKELNEEFNNRVEVIKWMVKNKIQHYVDVGNVIAAYYKDPDKVLERVREDANKISEISV